MIVTGLYIVKNEEDTIRRSMESIRDVCDEIIVVDTGSVDRTVKVVQELGAEVHHFQWVNDFSKARNFALSKAKGDLVIFIDADEWFPEPLNGEDRAYLEQLAGEGYRVFGVLRSELASNSLSQPVYNTRMLCGQIGLHYVGSIHESVNDTDMSFFLPERFLLYHSGYAGEQAKEKSERNLALLYGQFERETSPSRQLGMCFYIIRESSILEKLEESLRYIERFFEIWNRTKKSERPANIGICAYDLVSSLFSAMGEAVIPNSRYLQCCRDFVETYPGHPAAHYAMANYHYTRHRSFDMALESVERVEKTFQTYRIEDYPHDYVGAAEPRANARMLKGNILYDRGERDKAFDCYASILKNVQPSAGFLRRLLNLIKEQPPNDIITFLSAIPVNVTVPYIELLLSQILFYPTLRDVYMYFAVQHLKMTKQQSDISAIAALLSGNSCELVVEIANTMFETDPIVAGELYLLAAICSGDPELRRTFVYGAPVSRILEGYFGAGLPDALRREEIQIISRTIPALIFLGNEEVRNRFFDMFSEFRFIFSYILMSYCVLADDFAKLLPRIDIDAEALDAGNRAAFYRLMGHALVTIHDYESAWDYLRESYELVPGDLRTYKELRAFASIAPVYAEKIHALVDRFMAAMGRQRAEDEQIAAVNAIFGSRDDA